MTPEYREELKKLGKRIKDIRKHRSLKLADLEILCGIQDSKLSRYERGLESIEYFSLFRIAKGLGVEVVDLTNFEGPLPKDLPSKKNSRRKE